jgi:hypothetical protein
MILSVGGGTSPGMPRENIVAMLEALEEFNARSSARSDQRQMCESLLWSERCLTTR